MKTQDYIEQLLALNAEYLSKTETTKAITTFAFGLAEEVFELAAAETDEQELAELGDVYAYFVLLTHSLGCANVEITSMIELAETNEDIVYSRKTLVAYFGGFKRFTRENKLPTTEVIHALFACALQVTDICDYSEAKAYNIQKLTNRKARGKLYEGKGDNR